MLGGLFLSELIEKAEVVSIVAKQTGLAVKPINQVIELLGEGNTVPFIARYRKELTGGLDEVQIKAIEDQWNYVQNLMQRKEEVIRLIDEQGKLTDDLRKEIEQAAQLQKVEDLYRPYKQKRRTRATVAKEKGLEPLALLVWEQRNFDYKEKAATYFSEEHELHTLDEVTLGVNDILAEWISDSPEFRDRIRQQTHRSGTIESSVKNEQKDEKSIFEMYYEYQEPVRSIVSHRVLALNRGEKEEVLKVSIHPPEEAIIEFLEKNVIHTSTAQDLRVILTESIQDSYKRLIQPSVEREIRNSLSETAEGQAIEVFSSNLRNLLLQPPLKGKVVLGVDPAYRTGCKLAVVDETGKMLDVSVIHPTPPKSDVEGSEKKIRAYFEQYPIELIAIGNGTASRETEQFIAEMIQKYTLPASYMIVNEAGASVYSASKLAREEFPDLQVEERSAVSIARRVQDPLAELVKIDPKSIGVGQYQHDVSQKKLTGSLTFVVETAVNQVGVNVNTASTSLLQYVAGLSKSVANNVVKKREEVGKFTSRKQLKDIPRLGAKTFEQSIGFLRVLEGEEPLDKTSIHPESYKAAYSLLKQIECSPEDLGNEEIKDKVNKIDIPATAEQLDIGEPTLVDIIKALTEPGRDPRDDLPKPLLKTNVLSMEDLEQGMELEGTVRNVVDFGVFVDIGVKQDGLVHISKLSNKFVKHPMDVVSVGDVVTIWVENVDIQKQRIALTMLQK
ncbi:Tex family protein [Halobacillus amylolyticus]|uniref:RNA-binding transcriptional accessory protein n=1 Tax=Halobacillus amylolyticus TaxID=2932259 RepID=A0ABY4HA88_9BACI|nr:RNA-binding transcriptional accessory protein [Halobacillus amylolyticus]